MADKLELSHISRVATVPWRAPEDHLTECGREAAKFPDKIISRDEFVDMLKRWGQQRTSMFVCQTCWHTTLRYKSWDVDPVDAVRRDIYGQRDQESVLRAELWAIAALIKAHQEEFDGYLNGLGDTISLAQRRRAKHMRGHQP